MLGICRTSGEGLWSEVCQHVMITKLVVSYLSGETIETSKHGELRAYFDIDTWNRDGTLIYTDLLWIKDFRNLLRTYGFSEEAVNTVDYSESGMQGTQFVSLDIGQAFIRELSPLYNFTQNTLKTVEIAIELG